MAPPTDADAVALAERMRPADAAEVEAATGRDVLDVVRTSIAMSSECFAVFFDGELACVWGVAPAPGLDGVPGRHGIGWLLTTALVEQKSVTFWRVCKQVFRELLGRWDVLINAIDERHVQALRWGARLGFRFDAPRPFGAAGLPFVGFAVTREDLNV